MTRKEAVLQAAKELFAEKGFHNTTAGEVAERAGVAHGTVFHHFQSKDNLLLCIVEELFHDYIEGLEFTADRAASGWEALEGILRFHFRFGRERWEEVSILIRDIPRDADQVHSIFRAPLAAGVARIWEITARCLRQGQADGTLRDVPVDRTVSILRGLQDGLVNLKAAAFLGLPEMEEDVIAFCRRSLAIDGSC